MPKHCDNCCRRGGDGIVLWGTIKIDSSVSSAKEKGNNDVNVSNQLPISEALSSIYLALLEVVPDDSYDATAMLSTSFQLCSQCGDNLAKMYNALLEFRRLSHIEGRIFALLSELGRLPRGGGGLGGKIDVDVDAKFDVDVDGIKHPTNRRSLRQAQHFKRSISDDENVTSDDDDDYDLRPTTYDNGEESAAADLTSKVEIKYEPCSDSEVEDTEEADLDFIPPSVESWTSGSSDDEFVVDPLKISNDSDDFTSYQEPKLIRPPCPVEGCDKSYSNTRHLTRHMRKKHPNEDILIPSKPPPRNYGGNVIRHPCPVEGCEKSYFKTVHVNRHIRTAHPTQVFLIRSKPKIGDGQIKSEDGGEVKKLKCEICSKEFAHLSGIKRHVRHRHGETSLQYSCPVEGCGKVYSRSDCINQHLKMSHPTVTIPKKTRQSTKQDSSQPKKRLKRDKNDKTNRKPKKVRMAEPCPHCGKVMRADHLRDHLTTHSKERPHLCSHCGKTFRTLHTLSVHISDVHVQNRKFPCPQCDLTFIRKYVMQKHIKTMHEQTEPVTCEVCGKQFCHEQNLKVHLKIHQGITEFKCHICNKDFSNQYNTNLHIKTVHQGMKIHTKANPGTTRKSVAKMSKTRKQDNNSDQNGQEDDTNSTKTEYPFYF